MDIIIRNAKVRTYDTLVDIGIDNGLIADVSDKLQANAKTELDAGARLVRLP